MSQELKDILKPPFVYNGGEITCVSYGSSIVHVLQNKMIFDINGLQDSLQLDHDFGIFTAAALNEKYKRDFGEVLHWRIKHSMVSGDCYICPKCGTDDCRPYNFCRCCGQPLKPPIVEPEEKLEVVAE